MKARWFWVTLSVLALGALVGRCEWQKRQALRQRMELLREHESLSREVELRRQATEAAAAAQSPGTQCFGDAGAPANWRCR